MDKIRLMIASQEVSTGKGLETIFGTSDSFDLLGGFTFALLKEKAVLLQPDVILLDIPGQITKYGQDIIDIKRGCPCTLVLSLVGEEHGEKIASVLEYGLDGCIPRNIMRGCMVKLVELSCRTGVFCLPRSFRKLISCVREEKLREAVSSDDTFNSDTVNNVIFQSLTHRERDILRLMMENYSNREIAKKLFISEPTVKTHVSSVLRKLGQSNRAQAIVYSFKNGLFVDNKVAPK